MCGIIGVFTDTTNGFTNKQMDVLGQAIIINQFRGTDSTGLFAVDKDANSELHKVLGGAGSMFASPEWEKIKQFIFSKAQVVVGHGRSATRGTVKIENAHPFAKNFDSGERLKLVHNGTLEWEQDLPDFHKFSVDSEWIAEMLVRYGPEEALPKIRGAMALVWWNEKEKTINFFRNKDRPLHFNKYGSKFEQTFILASEAAAVKFLGERNGLSPIGEGEKKPAEAYYFKPQFHYALALDDLFGDWKIHKEYPVPKARAVVVPVPYNYGLGEGGEPYDPVTWRQRNFNNRYVPQSVWARTYDTDLEDIKSYRKVSVHFVYREESKDWMRITKDSWNTISKEPVDGPYIQGLRSMERIMTSVGGQPEKAWIRCIYVNENTKAEYAVHIPVTDVVVKKPDSLRDLDWNDADYWKDYVDTGCRKFSPGRKIRWTTKLGNQIVRHKAVVSDNGGCQLKYYSNNLDGEWNMGETVSMEITSIESVSLSAGRIWKCWGHRMTSKVDRAVDLCFYIRDSDKDAPLFIGVKPDNMPFVTGELSQLNLAETDRNEETGAVVVCLLRNVVPVKMDVLVKGKGKNNEAAA